MLQHQQRALSGHAVGRTQVPTAPRSLHLASSKPGLPALPSRRSRVVLKAAGTFGRLVPEHACTLCG